MNPPVKFYWLIHDQILLEPLVEPIENRVVHIKRYKSLHEIPTRLEWMREVLHPERLPQAVVEAGDKRVARGMWDFDEWARYYDTLLGHLKEIEALHKEECLGCPFDYEKHTLIFPKPQPSP